MKIVVSVIVYNRIENIKRWIHCWKQCNHGVKDFLGTMHDAQLVIIDNSQSDKIKELCKNVVYIPRKNVGMDIGAMQDVFRERLPGFPDYDYLIWCTDDTFPMSKDFILPFIQAFEKREVGISAMQIASSVNREIHVRTTGFCIKKEVAEQIKFPFDPITTKHQCYLFEHQGGMNTLTNQVREMGLSCMQVAPNKTNPLWDSGYWKRLDRLKEHEGIFNIQPGGNKVTFICTIYNSYPQIISSLICQTHKNWELILIHDGPSQNGMKSYIPNDNRINYIETDQRRGHWGHYYRQWALNQIREGNFPNTDYIVITNADNYYTPVFIEYLLKGFGHTTVATYCSSCTHSYKAWDILPASFQRGYIDVGQVMIKSGVAIEVGWRDIENHSSDWTFLNDIASIYSQSNFVRVKGNLFVHN